jgi:hypothetical protein
MLDVSVSRLKADSGERRFGYEASTSYGSLTGLSLHRPVTDGAFPVSLALHVIAVPYRADTPALRLDALVDRLERALEERRDGLESCLVSPESARVTVQITPLG